MTAMVTRPEGFDIEVPGGNRSHGVDQEWYGSYWRRLSGCGPSTASNMLRYYGDRVGLSRPTKTRQDMVDLMDEVWHFVTPGMFGLNSTEKFQQGMDRLMQRLNSPLRCRVLDVPGDKEGRPSLDRVRDFLLRAFQNDHPVAFLNLHNGSLLNLDRWHWVTLMGLSAADGQLLAQGVDNGKRLTWDLTQWLDTTTLGGGFVYCE